MKGLYSIESRTPIVNGENQLNIVTKLLILVVCYKTDDWLFTQVLVTPLVTDAATGSVLSKRCSSKFQKIHRKTPVPESLF